VKAKAAREYSDEECVGRERRNGMKGLLIVGKDGEKKIAMLENHLKGNMGAKEYPLEGNVCLSWPQEQPKTLAFQKGKRRWRLPVEEILYLEKRLRKVEIVLEGGKTVSFYSGMQAVMDQLGDDFCQCHKSYAVNLRKVVTLEEEGFRMMGGALVPVSQRRRKETRWRYEEFQEQKSIEKLRFSKTFSCFEI